MGNPDEGRYQAISRSELGLNLGVRGPLDRNAATVMYSTVLTKFLMDIPMKFTTASEIRSITNFLR